MPNIDRKKVWDGRAGLFLILALTKSAVDQMELKSGVESPKVSLFER